MGSNDTTSVGEDFLDFLPLFPAETEDAILARMRGWANEGLDPTADPDAWVDTRQGSHWYLGSMPMVREFARIYDLMGSEVPASGMLLWAWGSYLDNQAAVWQIERKQATYAQGYATFIGPMNTPIAAGVTVETQPASPDDPVPQFVVMQGGVIGQVPATPATPASPATPTTPATPASPSNSVTLPIQATQPGSAGDVGVGAITVPVTPLPGVSVYNYVPTVGGTDVETDEALRQRVLDFIAGGGSKWNQAGYLAYVAAWAGVGRVTVVPLWNGPNTVLVIVTDPNGQPVAASTVQAIQRDLDPVAGKGSGSAPVGHIVTVMTATALAVNVAATVRFEAGYSLDGFGGTIARRTQIQSAVQAYVASVLSGGEIVFEQIRGRIVTVPGLHDVLSLSVNNQGANIPVLANPPQAPYLVTPITLASG